MYHIFFIHSSVDGHVGCFHVLVTVNSAAVNTGVPVSFQTRVFARYMPKSGIPESYVALGNGLKKILLRFISQSVLPMFSSKSFITSGLTFSSLIH